MKKRVSSSYSCAGGIRLQKIVTRFYYPITIQVWYWGATRALEKEIGEGFSDIIARYDGRKVEIFRISDELHTRIKAAMLRYVEGEKFQKGVSIYQNLMQRFHSFLQNGNDIQEMIYWFGLLYPSYAASYFVPQYWEGEVGEKKKEVINKCREYRLLSEGILNMVDQWVVEYLNKKGLSPFLPFESVSQDCNARHAVQWMEKGYIFSQGKFYNISWDTFLRRHGFIFREEKVLLKGDMFFGQGVFAGARRGRVVVVLSPFDFSKVRKGDILVTPMTQVTFTPLFPKISAIITDEGGVTCHAAIISRELGIPCIVGTKIATQVLKDGDLVEVDAERGIVRRLKKEKR